MTMLRRTTAVVLSLLLLVQTCFATIEVDEEGLEELMGLGECAKVLVNDGVRRHFWSFVTVILSACTATAAHKMQNHHYF